MMIVCVCAYMYIIHIYIVYTGVYYMTTIKHHVFRVYIYIHMFRQSVISDGRNAGIQNSTHLDMLFGCLLLWSLDLEC